MSYVQCAGINKNGIQCQRVISKTSTPCYCFDHAIETDEQRQMKILKMTLKRDKNIGIDMFNQNIESHIRGMQLLLLQSLSCGSTGYVRQTIEVYIGVHHIKRDMIIELCEMSQRGYSVLDSTVYKYFMNSLEAFQCQTKMQTIVEMKIIHLLEILVYVGQVYITENFRDIRTIVREYFGYKSFTDIFGHSFRCKDVIMYYNASNPETCVDNIFELETVIDSLDELRFFS